MLGIQKTVGGEKLFTHFFHISDMKNAWNISQEQIYLHGSEGLLSHKSPGCSRNTIELKELNAAELSVTDGGCEKERYVPVCANVPTTSQ